MNPPSINQLQKHFESCRLCLSPSQPENTFPVTEDVSKKVAELLQVSLLQTRGYSSFICKMCQLKLNDYSSFREKIIDIQRSLSFYLCRVKEEEPSNQFISVVQEERECSFERHLSLESSFVKQETLGDDSGKDNDNFLTPVDSPRIDPLHSFDSSPLTIVKPILKKTKKIPSQMVKFKYDECNFTTRSENCYRTHIQKDHASKFQCVFCSISFDNWMGLEMHNRTTHKKNKSWRKCVDCPLKFVNKAEVFSHWKSQHFETIKKEMKSLKTAKELFESRDTVTCELCGVMIKERSINNHRKYFHFKVRVVECDFCGKKFSTRNKLEEHLVTHIPLEYRVWKYQCELCPLKFDLACRLKRHQKTHQVATKNLSLPCHCGKVYSSKTSLAIHMNFVHNRDKHLVRCQLCGKLVLKCGLKRHLNNVHLQKGRRNVECEECGRLYDTIEKFRKHKKGVHQKPELKLPCDFEGCNKLFDTSWKLNAHKDLVHLKIKNFICTRPNCSNAYTSKQKLDKHIAIFHDKLRQNCPINDCSFSVGRIDYMRNHLKKHAELNKEELQYYLTVIKTMKLV